MSGTDIGGSILAKLSDVLSQLGEDERRVMLLIGRRLLVGQRQYGVLDLATDKRDWRHEAGEEMADALVYRACEEAKKEKAYVPKPAVSGRPDCPLCHTVMVEHPAVAMAREASAPKLVEHLPDQPELTREQIASALDEGARIRDAIQRTFGGWKR